jgi:hypothetical protein
MTAVLSGIERSRWRPPRAPENEDAGRAEDGAHPEDQLHGHERGGSQLLVPVHGKTRGVAGIRAQEVVHEVGRADVAGPAGPVEAVGDHGVGVLCPGRRRRRLAREQRELLRIVAAHPPRLGQLLRKAVSRSDVGAQGGLVAGQHVAAGRPRLLQHQHPQLVRPARLLEVRLRRVALGLRGVEHRARDREHGQHETHDAPHRSPVGVITRQLSQMARMRSKYQAGRAVG